jgi:hypothetical protein
MEQEVLDKGRKNLKDLSFYNVAIQNKLHDKK